MTRTKTSRLAYLGVMTAIAVILSVLENMIPIPAPVPGIKLGLANVVALILLKTENRIAPALMLTVVRCVLGALFSGAITVLFFSLAGGIVSCCVMWGLLRTAKALFRLTGVSVAGAAAHNCTQILVAMGFMRDTAVIYYLPVLLAVGTVAGIATGFVAGGVLRVYGRRP